MKKKYIVSLTNGEQQELSIIHRPYDEDHPVVCLDESPHHLISETRTAFTDSKGVKYVDYEYRREGVADIFIICELKGGIRFVQVRDTHDSHQWAAAVAHIAEKLYPTAASITLVQDNLSAHRKSALYEVFDAERARSILRRIEIVPTLKHGSWLNRAEIELSVLNRVALKGRIGSKQQLQKQINAYLKEKNKAATQINWQFTTKDARTKLHKLYPNV